MTDHEFVFVTTKPAKNKKAYHTRENCRHLKHPEYEARVREEVTDLRACKNCSGEVDTNSNLVQRLLAHGLDK